MRDSAAEWFELNEPDTFEEAKRMFLENFWGEEEQARFRQRIYTGKYRPDRDATMADYALELARQAKLLVPPMTEHEIIRAVKGHFSLDIAREICATTVSNMKDIVKLLNNIESESAQARRANIETRRMDTESRRTGRPDYGAGPKVEYRGPNIPRYETRPRPMNQFPERANPRTGEYQERRWEPRNPGNGAEARRRLDEKEKGYRGPSAEQSPSGQ